LTNNFFGGCQIETYGPCRYSGIGGGPEVTYLPYRRLHGLSIES
jgi:hypothetical protein